MKSLDTVVAAAVLFVIASAAIAQAAGPGAARERGPYARIAFLRPHDGDSADFEAGYVRHLEWHRQAGDPWTWYGWSIWASSERQRWLVYATFGHSAAALDAPIQPAEDERDSLLNVIPHCEFTGSGLYEFLPAISKGSPEPTPTPRVEMTTVELAPGAAEAFEAAIAKSRSKLSGETLWYRMIAGGPVPRYLRLRPAASVAAIVESAGESVLPEDAARLAPRVSVEILNLRPTMSHRLPAVP
jgi:hypothetical protein